MIKEEAGCRLYYSLKSIFLHIDNQEKVLLSQFNLSIPRFYILMHIYDHPGINYIELSDLLLCTKSNTTRLVRAMQKDGLVQRNVNPEDRRSFHLHLTTRGKNLYEEVNLAYRSHIKQLLARFTEDQLSAYTAVSAHIEQVMEPEETFGIEFIDLQRRRDAIDVNPLSLT